MDAVFEVAHIIVTNSSQFIAIVPNWVQASCSNPLPLLECVLFAEKARLYCNSNDLKR